MASPQSLVSVSHAYRGSGMVYNFEAALDRSGSASTKWAKALHPDHLAMGLADIDFPAPPEVLAALEDRVGHGAFGYTDLTEGVIDAVVTWHGRRHGWALEPDTVFVSHGIMPSMALVLRGAIDPGAGVIVQTPAFGPIPDVVAANGFQVVENRLLFEDGRYTMDMDDLARHAARDDVAAFVLCSPHNPVGRVWNEDELSAVAEVCVSNDVLVLSDEIHGPVTFPWATFVPYGTVAPADSRYAVLFGPSKAFNLPSLKTSLAAVPHPELREAFAKERHRINEDFGVPALGVVALEASYRRGGPWLDAFLAHITANLELLESALSSSSVRVVHPEGTYLVWLDFRALGLGDEELDAALLEERVELERGIEFGAAGSGHMRMNVATTRDRVVEAAARIRRIAG